jgi:hypothetical protein
LIPLPEVCARRLYNQLTMGAIFQNVVPHGFFVLYKVLIINVIYFMVLNMG